MPCKDDRTELTGDVGFDTIQLKQRLDLATRLLCSVMRGAGRLAEKPNPEARHQATLDELRALEGGDLGRWWDKHLAEDAARKQRLRAQAIQKLTPEELEALGLNPVVKKGIGVGDRVFTLKDTHPEDYQQNVRANNQWGVVGVVVEMYHGHGVCYQVRHSDGTTGVYEPNELESA